MRKKHITKGSVFDDLGFTEAEAVHLKAKADLMLVVRDYIDRHGLTQTEAAAQLGVDQPQISRLLKGKIGLFTIDKLLIMLARINIKVQWKIATAA